jgi:hypothetical protein
VRLPKWVPNFPDGPLERVYLHWSGGDYATVYSAYHLCVALDEDGEPIVCETSDLRANMRRLHVGAEEPYAAHTRGRNSFAAGLAVAGMRDARPDDFGSFPLRHDLVTALCAVAARLCAFYAIEVEAATVMTHAEAALEDGYFGAEEDERWDIARLAPSPAPLQRAEAGMVGEHLRAMIRAS